MRRSIKYGLYAAVLAGVAGSTIAWASVDKTVTVEVDGQSRQIHTVASTVKGALADAGYQVGEHDIVAPALTADVRGGSKIVLQHGRLLHLSVDGSERDVWVTSTTVSQALADLGYESADLNAVSRSKRLPLTPTDLTLTTVKSVTLTQAGETTDVATTDVMVGDLLHSLGFVLGPSDTVTPSAATAITPGLDIVIKRVTHGTATAKAAVPFATTQVPDATMTKGSKKVVTAGKNGAATVVYAIVYVDGVEVGRTVASKTVITKPTNQVVKVGTKPAPVSVSASMPVSNAPTGSLAAQQALAQDIALKMVVARGWGQTQFQCLLQLWGHESGWRWNASNGSGAYGIPQALPGSKMASAGADWRTNPATQITWGLNYIKAGFGTPCGAWSAWQSNGSY